MDLEELHAVDLMDEAGDAAEWRGRAGKYPVNLAAGLIAYLWSNEPDSDDFGSAVQYSGSVRKLSAEFTAYETRANHE